MADASGSSRQKPNVMRLQTQMFNQCKGSEVAVFLMVAVRNGRLGFVSIGAIIRAADAITQL
jgi:hypothetical protein